MYKGFIFDLDGVLVDTARYHFMAWKRLADWLDIPFTHEDNERMKGLSRMDSLEIILGLGGQTYSDERKAELAEQKNAWYLEYVSNMAPSEILPGALAVLEHLKALGFRCALGSASRNAGLVLERTGLAPYFDAIVDGTGITNSKPDPEVFTKGAEMLHLPYGACVVFEDSQAGIDAAKSAGMLAVGIGEKGRLRGADIVIGSLSDFKLEMIAQFEDKKTEA